MQQRRAIIALAPRTDQRIPDCLRRWPITVRQPASSTPEPLLLEWAGQGKLDLSAIITRVVPLEAGAINDALDRLDRFSEDVRVVVRP
jgi:hypothetical protein